MRYKMMFKNISMDMKKIALSILLLGSMIMGNLQAQNNSNLITFGDETVTADEFIRAYGKNNNWATATEADIREYLDLFINFKLKVKEGVEMKLDTARKFKLELASYRNQSSSQFLVDKEVTEDLVQEACDRSKLNVRASHILINCGEMATAKDTAAAYAKCLSIRDEILSGQISFEAAAEKYSDDPSARDMVNPQTGRTHYGNKGDLGYFTAFDLIYDFENAAYNTKIGDISMPVRTKFGYHLIYVVDRVPAIQEITIAQIFVNDTLARDKQQSLATQQKLQAAMQLIKTGSFEEAVGKYSEDKNAADQGGLQEPFAPSRRQGDFVKAILSLKENEISEPIPSQYGWHIVKLVNLKPVELDDDAIYGIRNRISRDTRSHKSKASFIAKLKEEYDYREPARTKDMKFLLKNMPKEYFQTKDYDLQKCAGIEKLKPMAIFADDTITAYDFAKYIDRFKGMRISQNEFGSFLEERFAMYVQDRIMRYEQAHLMEKHIELRDLVQEFHDGMVLYEVNTLKVWAQAVQDSTGLEEFYNLNKAKYLDPKTNEPKPLNDIRAIVITDYQEYLDKQWVLDLRKKYNPVVDEKVFANILKKN